MSQDNDQHPLWKLFYHAAALGGALSLGNVFDNLIELKGMVLELVLIWKLVGHTFFDHTIGVVIDPDIIVPEFVKDYIIIGLLFVSANIRSNIALFGHVVDFPDQDQSRAVRIWRRIQFTLHWIIILGVILWPIGFIVNTTGYLIERIHTPPPDGTRVTFLGLELVRSDEGAQKAINLTNMYLTTTAYFITLIVIHYVMFYID
ncbi:MAG: hypothetical protein HQL36_01505 [Alphaproteobacteria bacterium]|nr:hypothetical protein [Alphaproteobacteria bacterium]